MTSGTKVAEGPIRDLTFGAAFSRNRDRRRTRERVSVELRRRDDENRMPRTTKCGYLGEAG